MEIKELNTSFINQIIYLHNINYKTSINGFMLNEYSKEQLELEFSDNQNIFYGVYFEKQLCGYIKLTNYQDDRIIKNDLEWMINEKEFILKHSTYLHHVAIDPKFQGKGIARKAYNRLKEKYQSIYCFIVQKPVINNASIKFHAKQGFKEVAQFKKEKYSRFEDYQCGLYLYKS